MARRGAYPGRRLADSGSGLLHKKSKRSPLPSIALVVLGACFLVFYFYRGSGSGGFSSEKLSIRDGGGSCTLEVERAIPMLKETYGEIMNKVLHVGPETCSVISKLLKGDGVEAWGVEPYDLDDVDSVCRSLVRKGVVRVADIKYPLPYKAKSFSLVIVSDALDYLSPNKLNKTLLEMSRLSMDGLVIFTGYPGQSAKISELPKFGRPAKRRSTSWWRQYFLQSGLEENQSLTKKFELAISQSTQKPRCQIFHLNSFDLMP